MAIVLFYILLWLLLFLAFALLALTQFQHRRATGTTELPSRRVMLVRLVAVVFLIMALAVSIIHEGGGFGSLLWVGLMILAAWTVAMILAWCPQLLAPLAFLMRARLSCFTYPHSRSG